MSEELMTVLQNVILPAITGIIAWITARQRNRKETESIMLDNIEKAVSVYKNMLDDMRERYDREIDLLKSRLVEANTHIAGLEAKLKAHTHK
jgi:hypothetical protein